MADSIGVVLTGDNSKFASMVDQSTTIIGRLNSALNAVGVGFSVGAATAFFKGVIGRASDLQDLSDRLGVSTDHLQAFDFAVRQAGGTTEQANITWDKARKALDNLAIGTPEVVAQFKALGLSASSFQGLGLEGSLELIAKGYAQNAESAGAYDAVTDILGSKSAPALNAVITQLGTEAFPKLLEALDASGNKIEKDTIRQLDTLGDRAQAAFGKLQVAGAAVVGWFVKLGEVIGQYAAMKANQMDGIETSLGNTSENAKKAVAAVKVLTPMMKGLDDEGKKSIQTDLEKDRISKERLDRETRLALLILQEYDLEKAMAQEGLNKSVIEAQNITLAEIRKQIRIEEKGLSAEEEKHAGRMREATAKEIQDKRELLTFNQQMAAFRADEQGWLAVLADHEISQEVRRNAEFELAKTRAKMRDVELDKKKEDAELAALLIKPATELTEQEKLRLEVLQGVVTQKQLDDEKTALIAGAVAGTLTPAEKERLAVLLNQKAVLDAQLETAKAITVTISRTGKGVDQQSDDSLEGVRNRLRQQIDDIKRRDFGVPGGVGGKGKPAELYLLENELFNLEKEMNQRQEVRDYASRFGEQKARQQFGDTVTDKALRDWNNDQKGIRVALEDIQQRLENYFRK